MLESQSLQEFSINNWYNKFKNVSPETYIFEIPPELLVLLQANDVDFKIEEVCSQDFVLQLKDALSVLGYNVFVKNNWHAPTDAKMFSMGYELKATNLNDMILYLSTSVRVSDDFTANKNGTFHIVMKPWINIHPASEFRCIVINNVLRGITPRDWPTYYDHFDDEGSNIITVLSLFFEINIKDNFPKKNFTFDVYIDYPNRPYLLDFGLINSKTNFYAFSWNEIYPLLGKTVGAEIGPVFRYLESDIGIMSKADALHKFQNPQIPL